MEYFCTAHGKTIGCNTKNVYRNSVDRLKRFYYTKELQDDLLNAYNNANSEACEIAKILDTPEKYFKLCAKMNKLHEDYIQQISVLRKNISTDWDVMNILDNTVIDFKFK